MKNTIIAVAKVFPLLAVAGTLGCGDDGDASTRSGVGGSKLVAEVTDAEAQQVCRWVEKESESLQGSTRELCTASALAFTSSESQCSTFVDTCVMSLDEEPPEEEMSDCDDARASDAASCGTLTVGEYEDCIGAVLDGFKRALSELSCKNAGQPPQSETTTTPSACDRVVELCPELVPELAPPSNGSDGGFSCGDGTTVPTDWVCDEEPDCEDGRDEQDC